MKIQLLSMFITIFIAPMAVSSPTLTLSDSTRIEVVESLPTRELWNSIELDRLVFKNVVVRSQMFDPEARPNDGGWRGCGIVMIGTGDLGIQPVTIRISTIKSCNLTLEKADGSLPQSEARFTVNLSQGESLRVNVAEDLRVTIDEKPVGHIGI